MKEISIKFYNSIAEVELAKNLLKEQNIPAYVRNRGVDPGDMGDNYGADLFVADKDEKRAKEILGL